ncbi:MAG TPA: D-alanyl-D-alanine carboxypeptidase/D-alanyl-D-alanine-endopeptidase [Pirellulales bacterium]|nr:D-alanyl-D-alanine carboxypeptidase/D-alanyl-D-alanine-endopeptidase [Pirellulales bacterium]
MGIASAFVYALAALLFLHSSAAADPLAEKIGVFIDEGPYKHGHWGVLVADLGSGDVLFERAPDKLFAPASVTKLYSVAAALDAFGADYRFETPIYARGQIDAEGKLQGDLILVASGDPTLGGRAGPNGEIAYTNSDHIYGDGAVLTDGDPLAGLNELAAAVRASGVRHVRGDVLVDDRLFEHARGTGSGPALLTPIVVNDNLIDVVVTPATPGSPAKVVCRPVSASLPIDAQVETVAAEAPTSVTVASPDDRCLVIRGQIAAGRKPLLHPQEVADPASFARSLLIEALRRADVSIEASPLAKNQADHLPDRSDYAGMRRVAQLTSPPFSESARLILKVSHNLHASMLPLLLATRHEERTLADGLKHQRQFLIKAGVDADSISFGGAAGGDPADYVTPRATVALLRYMATRDDFAVFDRALPVLGEDGTLAHAVPAGSPVRGKAQAKTGTMFWHNRLNGGSILTSKSLAGYLTAASGRRLAFAVFVNNLPTKTSGDRERIGKALGQLCEVIFESL